mgnify:CR=1 FL=1
MKDEISVNGARAHNLKNIDLNIPKNKLVVITNTTGLIDKGYNGTYNVDSVSATNDLEFTYTTNWFIIKLNKVYYKYTFIL